MPIRGGIIRGRTIAAPIRAFWVSVLRFHKGVYPTLWGLRFRAGHVVSHCHRIMGDGSVLVSIAAEKARQLFESEIELRRRTRLGHMSIEASFVAGGDIFIHR